jgi:hypothetical protein
VLAWPGDNVTLGNCFVPKKASNRADKKAKHLSGFSYRAKLPNNKNYAVVSTLGLAFDTITIAGRIKRPFNS